MEDILTIAYEGEYQKDISVLMVSRKTDDGMEIAKVFTEDEADNLYKRLIENEYCEWTEYDYKTIRSPHKRDWSIPSMIDFKYCPYCGKKIRIKVS